MSHPDPLYDEDDDDMIEAATYDGFDEDFYDDDDIMVEDEDYDYGPEDYDLTEEDY